MYKSEILEERLAIGVLLTLYREGKPMQKGVLVSKLAKAATTVNYRVSELLGAGLITEVQEETRPFRKFVELTPRGKKVAKHLAAIEDILESSGSS
jgi:DNA-binding MarR family transcriptional regulator